LGKEIIVTEGLFEISGTEDGGRRESKKEKATKVKRAFLGKQRSPFIQDAIGSV
jgi:hypothetical protein